MNSKFQILILDNMGLLVLKTIVLKNWHLFVRTFPILTS